MLQLVFTIFLLILGLGAFIVLVARMHRFGGGPRLIVRLFVLSVLVAVLASAGWLPDGCYSGDDTTVQTERE